MTNTPTFLQDAQGLLTEQGFITSEIWYHGTSSTLVDSIKKEGLKRSGDTQLNEAAKKTMATIGNHYTQSLEPVFLTQSKTLAFYWAEQTVKKRSVRVESTELPVVFSVRLPESLNTQVKPDVGAASLLLLKEGEDFMLNLAAIYQVHGLGLPEIDLMKADRLEYLNKLGMAYINTDIGVSYLELLNM
ncbi:MAG: hypothetical protein ACI9ES_002420 [Oceanospirillaceae bacterium]|jgi:hypothetical protein